MKMAVATLAIVLLLVAFSSIVTAQGMEQETEEQGTTGEQSWMTPMMQSGMICPM